MIYDPGNCWDQFAIVLFTLNHSRIQGCSHIDDTWWRHQMETFSALLAFWAGNSSMTGKFPAQRPVTRSFGVFFYLRLHKRLSKHSQGLWSETPSSPLWRHCNALTQSCLLTKIKHVNAYTHAHRRSHPKYNIQIYQQIESSILSVHTKGINHTTRTAITAVPALPKAQGLLKAEIISKLSV